MASWQNDPAALQNEQDIVYLVAMNENCNDQPPTPDNLDRWQSELGFDAVMLTDPARSVYGEYADANGCEMGGGPGGSGCSNAVTVYIDKHMRIRHFGTTYACGTGGGSSCGETATVNDEDAMCIDEGLEIILGLLAED